MKMTINQNTINNRIEITFSEKPSAEIRTAIQENAHFVYRNIGGKLMWLCTARYFNKDDYNGFIKTYCQDFEKTILKDGKAVKKTTKTTAKKTASKKTTKAKTETKDNTIAELQAQIEALTKAVQTLTELQTSRPQLTAKRVATDNSNSNAPKCKYQLMVNGRVVR